MAVNATTFETLIVETADRIRTITMNRPAVYNAFSDKLTYELQDALKDAERDDEATRLLRRFRGQEEAAAADPEAEKIHYFVFEAEEAASAAKERLRELGQVHVDADDAERRFLIAVSTTVAASRSTDTLCRHTHASKIRTPAQVPEPYKPGTRATPS